jgi:N-acetylglutamate synthase
MRRCLTVDMAAWERPPHSSARCGVWDVLASVGLSDDTGRMPLEADTVASALASTWEHLFAAIPSGWVRREDGIVGGASGVPVPTLNGVWPEKVVLDEGLVSEVLDQIASSGLPYCLQLRPGAPEQLAALAARRGMIEEESLPLMVLENPQHLKKSQEVEHLGIRQLAAEEAPLHAQIAARGFEAPEEVFVQLMTPAVLARPGTRCYVGTIGEDVVTTGIGVTLGDFVGIFNIATPPEHRGHGFGAAVTARAASDGFATGAKWSYLQSSVAGFRVYSRLGYNTLERWVCWVTPT